MNLKSYFRENWGFPFVIGFMLLLVASAVELGIGQAGAADDVAVYAFYSLVIGVVLQIASYVRYGEGVSKPEPTVPESSFRPPTALSRKQKVIAAVLVATVALGAGVALTYYYAPATLGLPRHYPQLTGQIASAVLAREPDGSTSLAIVGAASGGEPPYNYTVIWADNFSQTDISNTTAVFVRHLIAGQQAPTSANVTIMSADGQEVRLAAHLVNATALDAQTTLKIST